MPWMYLFISSALSRWKASAAAPKPRPLLFVPFLDTGRLVSPNSCATALGLLHFSLLSTLLKDQMAPPLAGTVSSVQQAGIADFCLCGNLQIESRSSELSLVFLSQTGETFSPSISLSRIVVLQSILTPRL